MTRLLPTHEDLQRMLSDRIADEGGAQLDKHASGGLTISSWWRCLCENRDSQPLKLPSLPVFDGAVRWTTERTTGGG